MLHLVFASIDFCLLISSCWCIVIINSSPSTSLPHPPYLDTGFPEIGFCKWHYCGPSSWTKTWHLIPAYMCSETIPLSSAFIGQHFHEVLQIRDIWLYSLQCCTMELEWYHGWYPPMQLIIIFLQTPASKA